MKIALLGFPWDRSSSYARGAAHGPYAIRSRLYGDDSSPFSLDGVNCLEVIAFQDFAALPDQGDRARDAITGRVAAALDRNLAPLSLGGDHSITFPILRAMRDMFGKLNVLHFDAHTDLYENFEGDPYSHACPFARALEDGCIETLVQVGLRSVTPACRKFGAKHGVIMLGADEIDAIPFDKLAAPLYVTIDLDGFDPAFAPGVSHPEPGGLSSREVIGLLRRLPVAPVGADIVELNPERDVNLLTAHLAARLVKELAGIMATR